jgi:NAD(P)-dependent dehydrogenase (short-subunit alcohol dehydrogenase family)
MAPLSGALELGLSQRVAIVTGATGGIGRQVARLLAEAGATVHAVDRDEAALTAAVSDWAGNGHTIEAADLSNVGHCARVVETATRLHGSVDILVSVHALLLRQDIADVDQDAFDQQMSTNARSQFFLAQAVLPKMTEQKFGRIVLFTSPSGFAGALAKATAYAMTKASAMGLSRSIARRFGQDNVTCNLVSPGSTDTAMLRNELSDADLDAIRGAIPLRRLADPEEIAMGAVYLVSRWGNYVNGHMLTIDGGSTMGA